MTADQDRAFLDVQEALLADPDDDVAATDDGLTVRGDLFAVRSSAGDLLVLLPASRAADLVARGVGREDSRQAPASGAWVLVSDVEDWVELATEAHQFVGEPAVGRDS